MGSIDQIIAHIAVATTVTIAASMIAPHLAAAQTSLTEKCLLRELTDPNFETSVAGLTHLGFSEAKAREVLIKWPQLAEKMIQMEADPTRTFFFPQSEEGSLIDTNSPHVTSVYRGVRVEKEEDFDPDFNGYYYVATNPNFPISGYATPHPGSKPVGLLIEYKVPSFAIHVGSRGYYVLGLGKLSPLGVNTISPFISRIGFVPLNAKKVDQVEWHDYPLKNTKNGL